MNCRTEGTDRLRLEAGGSPREEQPLIPRIYLQQQKEREVVEKEKKREVEREQIRQRAEEAERRVETMTEEERRRQEAEDRREVEKRLKSFRHITENQYLCSRKINKQFRLVLTVLVSSNSSG